MTNLEPCPFPLLYVRLQANYFISLCLTCLIYKTGVPVTLNSDIAMGIKSVSTCKILRNCVWHIVSLQEILVAFDCCYVLNIYSRPTALHYLL